VRLGQAQRPIGRHAAYRGRQLRGRRGGAGRLPPVECGRRQRREHGQHVCWRTAQAGLPTQARGEPAGLGQHGGGIGRQQGGERRETDDVEAGGAQTVQRIGQRGALHHRKFGATVGAAVADRHQRGIELAGQLILDGERRRLRESPAGEARQHLHAHPSQRRRQQHGDRRVTHRPRQRWRVTLPQRALLAPLKVVRAVPAHGKHRHQPTLSS
jgi:hypothetical protein